MSTLDRLHAYIEIVATAGAAVLVTAFFLLFCGAVVVGFAKACIEAKRWLKSININRGDTV